MSAVECGRCSRRVQDGASLCWTCANGFVDLLGTIEWLIDDLDVTLAKQDRVEPPGGGKRTRGEFPLPVRLDVPAIADRLGSVLLYTADQVAKRSGIQVDATQLVRAVWVPAPSTVRQRGVNGSVIRVTVETLARCDLTDLPRGWCAHCQGHELPIGLDPDDEVTLVRRPRELVRSELRPSSLDVLRFAAKWLAEHVGALRRLEDAVALVDRATDAIEAAHTCVDIPVRPNLIGRCEKCDQALYAEPDSPTAVCENSECGHVHTDLATLKARAIKRMRLYPATAAQIAAMAGEWYGKTIRYGTINVWAHREKFRMIDRDPQTGAPRYRIGDVLDYADRQERKRQREAESK